MGYVPRETEGAPMLDEVLYQIREEMRREIEQERAGVRRLEAIAEQLETLENPPLPGPATVLDAAATAIGSSKWFFDTFPKDVVVSCGLRGEAVEVRVSRGGRSRVFAIEVAEIR